MTRTARSTSLRAIIKDRSESRTGLDKSDRKHGAGAYNWGSVADERDLEVLATEDLYEDGVLAGETTDVIDELASTVSAEKSQSDGSLGARRPSGSTVSEEERQQARLIRARALKEGADLVTIARTSAAVSTSPPSKASEVVISSDSSTDVVS